MNNKEIHPIFSPEVWSQECQRKLNEHAISLQVIGVPPIKTLNEMTKKELIEEIEELQKRFDQREGVLQDISKLLQGEIGCNCDY